MTFSLNEVEAIAKKAARGAGCAWGVAEDASKAVRWLCAHDVDGCAALAGALMRADNVAFQTVSPDISAAIWQADGPFLCPLVTGCALSDLGLLQDEPLEMRNVVAPILLMPFVATLARVLRCRVSVTWDGGGAVTDGEHLCLSGFQTALAQTVRVEIGGAIDAATQIQTRARPDLAAWSTLTAFAQRTYAPATDESRARGAG